VNSSQPKADVLRLAQSPERQDSLLVQPSQATRSSWYGSFTTRREHFDDFLQQPGRGRRALKPAATRFCAFLTRPPAAIYAVSTPFDLTAHPARFGDGSQCSEK
jgi:hypothetical protein